MNNVRPILLLFSSVDLASEYVRKIGYDDEVLIVSSEFANHLDVQVTPMPTRWIWTASSGIKDWSTVGNSLKRTRKHQGFLKTR